MTALSIVLAVSAACASATASVLQRRAARTESRRDAAGLTLLVHLARNPVWVAGVGAIVVGFGLHAAALAVGPIVLVQPVLVLKLVLALLIAAMVFRTRVSAREWAAIGA